MCRSVLAESVDDDDDDDDSDASSYETIVNEVSLYALQSARWLFARAENEPIDAEEEDEEEEEEEDDADDDSFVTTRSDRHCISIDDIAERLVSKGLTFKDIIAYYICPHENHLEDCDKYSLDFMKRTHKIVNDIIDNRA